ncbi:hypothetical protein YC2023_050938 [Brassica napus]
MGKGGVVIAGSVNNDFEHSEINGPTVGTRWAHGPRERALWSLKNKIDLNSKKDKSQDRI